MTNKFSSSNATIAAGYKLTGSLDDVIRLPVADDTCFSAIWAPVVAVMDRSIINTLHKEADRWFTLK